MTTYLVAFALLVLTCLWFFWPRDEAAEPTVTRRPGDSIDHAELEQAEFEVGQAADEDGVRDWGPGAVRPPLA